MVSRPILCVTHNGPGDAERVAAHLTGRGRTVILRQPNAGDALPDPATLGGAVLFGGENSANDLHVPAIAAETAFIHAALARELPLFGICLGAQMLARALGSTVGPRPDGRWEVGWRAVTPTPEGASFFGEARWFYQWHGEGFTPPPGAEPLGSTPDFAQQAFRRGRVIGVQFHPEVTQAIMRAWVGMTPEDLDRPGADPFATQEADAARWRPAAQAWLAGALDAWLAD
jgi:GMP synthase (glutamine-hydrolysing)